MCLEIYGFKTKKEAVEFSKKPKKATEDIVVYKVLDDYNKSPYQYFLYIKGREYYRFGDKLFKTQIDYSYWYNCFRIKIYDGLHSYKTDYKARNSKDSYQKVVKMVIPKGALYFESNKDKEIVSSKLWWPDDSYWKK